MGAFHPRADDHVPPCDDGRAAATLVVIGNAGPAMWRAFSAAPRAGSAVAAASLDCWAQARIGDIAAILGATPLAVTEGPPYPPIQRWARRAGAYHPSPLGLLIHPDHGLWHAFRGALIFARRLTLGPRDTRPSPCASCADQPCLSGCPVAAFDAEGYRVGDCTRHLDSGDGEDCLDQGCRARRACPVGREVVYERDQARHHMTAFLSANRETGV